MGGTGRQRLWAGSGKLEAAASPAEDTDLSVKFTVRRPVRAHAFSTNESITFLSPAFSNATVSLLPSIWVMTP